MMTRHSTQAVIRQQESIKSKSVSFLALFLSKMTAKLHCINHYELHHRIRRQYNNPTYNESNKE